MKKILFIYKKKKSFIRSDNIHDGWVDDCRDIYDIKFWGKGYNEISYDNLISTIDS